MGATARADGRQLRLGVQLLAADAVGPHAGGVHHVVGADLEAAAADPILAGDPPGAAVLVDQLQDLAAVRDHRAEALRLAEHGEHQPHVVGLAVVEEVRAARLAPGQSRQQVLHLLAVHDPVAVGAPVLLRAVAAVPQAAPLTRHHVVHVQADAHEPVRSLALERRHEQRQRPDQVRRQVHEQ